MLTVKSLTHTSKKIHISMVGEKVIRLWLFGGNSNNGAVAKATLEGEQPEASEGD